MGRVFTNEEIANGAVPHPDAFIIAAGILMRTVSEIPVTDGAMVFGSTYTRSANRRSDLDLLISYHAPGTARSDILRLYGEVFADIRNTLFVPVESTIESVDDLREGNHSLDPLFMQNLLGVRSWSGKNPASLAKPSQESWSQVFQRYAIAKDRKFAKALTDSKAIDEKTMQRALEIPAALGRKAIGVLYDDSLVMTKAMILDRLQTIIIASGVTQSYNTLIDADAAYSNLVNRIVAGSNSVSDHNSWLKQNYEPVVVAAVDYTDGISRYVRNVD